MKREIKFRVWDHNTNTMMIPDYFELYDGKIGWIEASREAGPVSGNDGCSDQFEIMEYTGLHDKNGREIYEGDIVRSSSRRQREKSFVGDVCYGRVDPSFTIHDKDGHNFRLYSSGEYRTYEVIGNILENQELMEVAEHDDD